MVIAKSKKFLEEGFGPFSEVSVILLILFVAVVVIFVFIVVIVVVIVVITDVEQVLLGRYSSPLQWSPQPNK